MSRIIGWHKVPDTAGSSSAELTTVRRVYARKMLAVLGVENPALEAAYAAVPRELFLGPPPWNVALPYDGLQPLTSSDPTVVYEDILISLDPTRGVNNGSPSLHAKLLDALNPHSGDHIVHIGAGTGYYTAILSELVGPGGHVTAVEFDGFLGKQAKAFLADRSNVTVVVDDGFSWPRGAADGIYVSFSIPRPADRWIEALAPEGRLVFPLGVTGKRRRHAGGKHSERGAALLVERRLKGFRAHAICSAYFVCAEGPSTADVTVERERLRESFDNGGLNKVRSLVWKRPASQDSCWFLGEDWALTFDEL
jgi:protein-L-isoaspartate(D-aspartate) O-methyltransferase